MIHNSPRMSKKEMEALIGGVKKVGKGLKNYGKSVAGGAGIVGEAIKNKVLKVFRK